ncbi:MAG: V-type ATP synthase subunit K [archaeon]
MIALSVALTMIGSSFAAAWAEKGIGSAAVGAIAEKPEETFSKVLILTVIPETIVIFGLVIAILMLGKMG